MLVEAGKIECEPVLVRFNASDGEMTHLQEVSLNDFEGLDRAFYLETTRFFDSEQFHHLGDLEELAETRKHLSTRTCIRILAADDGSTVAAIYHVPPVGAQGILTLVTPLKFVELETELTDGGFLATTNNGLGITNRHVDRRVEIQARPEQLLALHRQRLRDYLEDHPGAQIRPQSSLRDVIDAQHRQRLLKSRPAPDRSRRTARVIRQWVSELRQGIDRRRVAIASISAIILVALAASFLVVGAPTGEREPAPELTPEQVEQAAEGQPEKETRPPPGVAWWLIVAMMAVAIFFLCYEALRFGLLTALVQLVGRGREEDPKASLESARDRSPLAGGRRSTRPETIGKVVFAAGLGLALAISGAGRSDEGFDAARDPTLEADGAEVEPGREEASRRDAVHSAGFIATAATLGLYELAGTLAAAAVALATGGTISRGAHLFLRVSGILVWVLGSLSVFVWIDREWPGERPWWLTPPAMLAWTFAGLVVLGRLADKIPVRCPECGGRAYRKGSRPTVWECRECDRPQGRGQD